MPDVEGARDMRRVPWAIAVAIFSTSAASCAGPAADPTPPAPPVPGSFPSGPPAVEPLPVEAGRAAPPGRYDQPVDVLAYDLEIAVSDTAGWIAGRAALQVEVTGALAEPLALDFTGLAVEEVTVEGTPVDARHEGGLLHIPLPPGRSPVSVEVLYRGVPDDGLVLGPNVHGDPAAFADNWPNRARFWFPSVDHPSDKARARFTIHAPAAWTVVANGRRAGPATATPPGTFGPPSSSARRTWRWEQDVPVSTYNMVFGGAVLSVSDVGLAACGRTRASPSEDDCVEVTTWLFPQSVRAGSPSFERAADMVDHFAELIGPFPFAKLAHVQSSTRFGGMENASAIFYSERAIAAGRDIEGTVSHETAHQWFGDSVTERDWNHLWLSEGFATYFGAQFFEAADGPEALRRRMEDNRRAYLDSGAADHAIVDPGEDDLFALLNANNYQKGGWVLHMLRGLLGDDPFFRGIREYYERFADSTALTGDLQEVMEGESDQELGWFFDQWIFRPGHPVFRIDHEWRSDSGEAVIVVRQEQDPSWPVFRVPTVLEVRHAEGAVRVPVTIDERVEEFRLELPAPPHTVVLDPDGWVLKETLER